MESPRLRMARVGLLLWTSNRPKGRLSETRPSSTTCVVGRLFMRLVPPETCASKIQWFQKLLRKKSFSTMGRTIRRSAGSRCEATIASRG